MFGFSVTFMKVVDGKLDLTDSYESEWIGSKGDANPPVKLGGDGDPVLGFVLRSNPREVTAMGLMAQTKRVSPQK